MGIKHFFFWYKNQFKHNITSIGKGERFSVPIDTLLLDMNGIFHNSTQKIYEYGAGKKPERLLKKNPHRVVDDIATRKRVYADVCDTIGKLVHITKPRKRVFLGTDGCAPISKQNQQRQRRFRSAAESGDSCVFDSNSITPGTEFMDGLSTYIDGWLINKKIEDPLWKSVEVVFSDEKVPGEGEHKAVEYIRDFCDPNEIFCINGLDADLIMLSMATHCPNFYIIRDDTFDPTNEYFCIDVTAAKKALVKRLAWEDGLGERDLVNDFIFMCFLVGNDFLPHIPSVEIIEDGIEMMIDVYKGVGKVSGHLTETKDDGAVLFRSESLRLFLDTIGKLERGNIEAKLGNRKSFFPDPLMMRHASNSRGGKWNINIDSYKSDYHKESFNGKTKEACHQYIQGLQWVITYYTTGCPSWTWYFPYQYAPMASTLAQHVDSFVPIAYPPSQPSEPFQQLLSVLPPKSARLLPKPLGECLTDKTSEIHKFCPDKLKIDLAGKRREWEGITILPMMDQRVVMRALRSRFEEVSPEDKIRNIQGFAVLYEAE